MNKQTKILSCPNCGHKNDSRVKFCELCGNAMSTSHEIVANKQKGLSVNESSRTDIKSYCPQCNLAFEGKYKHCPNCGAEIWGTDWKIKVTGANAEEVQTVAKSLAGAMSQKRKPQRPTRNPWISGSFYLATMAIVLALFLAASRLVNPLILPIVIAGAILAVSVIGALQLRQDKSLNEKNFLKLMLLTFRQLPFIGKKDTPNKK